MSLEYARFWNYDYKELGLLLTKEEVKRYHEKKKPYVVLVKQDEKMKYVVKMNFNIYYCVVLFLDRNPENIEFDGYVMVNNSLFLKNRKTRVDGKVVSYLYETDGKYTKKYSVKK